MAARLWKTGQRVDVTFDVAGAGAAVEDAVEPVRPAGCVILAGIPAEDHTTFSTSVAWRKGLTIKLVRRMNSTYPRAICLVEGGQVDVRSLVMPTFPLERAAKPSRTV